MTPATPTHSPARITNIWRDVITHPAGASGEVAIVHVYYDWTDGAQTCRCRPDGAWLCVHPGTSWPDALEACDHIEHIEALTDGRS